MSKRASITILAIDRDETLALQDWTRGLDWVRWMLGDVRSHLPPLSTAENAPHQEEETQQAWDQFARDLFLPVTGPLLCECWQAAHAGRTKQLARLAGRLEAELPPVFRERSNLAAQLLLRSTRHAEFQDVLGKHRAAINDARCPAHLLPVWAALGVLFQLGLANVCAEYLRLEWAMLSLHCPDAVEPCGPHGIIELTQRLIHASPQSLRAANAEIEPCGETRAVSAGETA